MFEPFTIAATAAGLVGTCGRLTGYIYTFINKSQNVDTAVQVLAVEIDSLSRVLGSISTSFNDPSLAEAALESHTGHERQHWENVERSLHDCSQTLKSLEKILENINKIGGGILWRPRKVIKMGMKSENIALAKQQIAAYRQTLSLSFQLITVYPAPCFQIQTYCSTSVLGN